MPHHVGKAVRKLVGKSKTATHGAALGLGTSPSTLYRWYAREEWPDRLIEKAATYFGVSEAWLRTGDGDRYADAVGGDSRVHRAVERLFLRYEQEMKRLSQKYTRELLKIARGEDIENVHERHSTASLGDW